VPSQIVLLHAAFSPFAKVGGTAPGAGDDALIVPGATHTVTASTTVNSVTAVLSSPSSQWTLFSALAPTDVAMMGFNATRYGNRVLLEWQTGYEVNNLGFNIYREKNGKP
jgi:hypothetical protein